MIRVYSKLDYEVIVKYGDDDLIIPARVYAMDIYDETKLGPIPKGIQVEYVTNPPVNPDEPGCHCSDPSCLCGIKFIEIDGESESGAQGETTGLDDQQDKEE